VRTWPVLRGIREQAERTLTRRAILQRWPDGAQAPAKLTLWRWPSRAVGEGRVLQDGQGHRKDPYLYRLPGMVEKWQQDFLDSFLKRLENDDKGNATPPRS
jgi:hypothetical protein